MSATPKPSHSWQPVEPPGDPLSLAVPALRALESLWKGQRDDLESAGVWQPFWERMSRWWSIETGVVEGIFDISLGATRALVEQGLLASLIPHGESNRPAAEVIAILKDHREALDMVLDVVGGSRQFTVAWIRELHALICRHQDSADAVDQFGNLVRIPLPKGTFKLRPNHVELPGGGRHEYCPPEHVASEMDRLVQIHAELPEHLPEVRSAWLHHAFTQIHPFEDGNGRVARALASIDFIRARLFPLLIERQQRETEYIPALIQADKGRLESLVQLFAQRQQRAVLRAISTADSLVEKSRGIEATLDLAAAKLRRRSEVNRRSGTAMQARLASIIEIATHEMERTRDQISGRLPGIRATIHRRTKEKDSWWRSQIVAEAQRNGYWADLNQPREWVNLELRDGGLTNFVVVLHFVGNPSPGNVVAIAFVLHRAHKDDTPLAESSSLSLDPLPLYPNESEVLQRERFLEWLGRATQEAIQIWTRYL